MGDDRETVATIAQLYLGNILYALELAAISLEDQSKGTDAAFYRGIARKLAEARGRESKSEADGDHRAGNALTAHPPADLPPDATRNVNKKNAVTGSAPAPIREFKSQKEFATWLEKNHASAPGLWVRIAKKGAGTKSITYPEGLEAALCYGWIDAQKLPESETAWLQRFMPRRPRSIWSKINREKALALIASGEMKPAGLEEIERARKDGRWEAAYDSPGAAAVPADFEKELDRHPKAKAFFERSVERIATRLLWRIQTAKLETRERRIKTFIEMLEKGETLH